MVRSASFDEVRKVFRSSFSVDPNLPPPSGRCRSDPSSSDPGSLHLEGHIVSPGLFSNKRFYHFIISRFNCWISYLSYSVPLYRWRRNDLLVFWLATIHLFEAPHTPTHFVTSKGYCEEAAASLPDNRLCLAAPELSQRPLSSRASAGVVHVQLGPGFHSAPVQLGPRPPTDQPFLQMNNH